MLLFVWCCLKALKRDTSPIRTIAFLNWGSGSNLTAALIITSVWSIDVPQNV